MSRKITYDTEIQQKWFLDDLDVHLADTEGTKRQEGKEVGKYRDVMPIAKGMTALSIHIFGARGELVVCRILKINPLEQWAMHTDYTKIDDGVDIVLHGLTMQVKSRVPGGDYALTRNRGKSVFKADIGVLVWLDGREATVAGAFSKDDWDRDAGKIDFGNEQRWGFKGSLTSLESVINSLRDRQ